MPYLAPEVVTRWSNAKKNLAASLAKVKPGGILKKETIAAMKKNLDTFDSGLTPKLKKAAAAKTPEEAVTYLNEAVAIIKNYKTRIGDWTSGGPTIGKQCTTILNEVETACESAINNAH